MNSNPFFPFIRELSPEPIRIYNSSDILRFRPSFEYLQTRESCNCFHCKCLVYKRSGDIKPLTFLDIVAAKHNAPYFVFDNAILDTFSTVSKKIDNFFGSLFGNGELKKNIEGTCKNIQNSLKIDSSLLGKPLFHRCPTCLYAWPLHLEIKQRIGINRKFSAAFSSNQFNGLFSTIPLTKNFLEGVILLDDPSEEQRIGLHVYDFKRFQLQHHDPGLLPQALKKIRISDAAGSLSDLMIYTTGAADTFFVQQVQILQSRLANFNREKIGGRLSPSEELTEFNRICNAILLLIEEIERYKNM